MRARLAFQTPTRGAQRALGPGRYLPGGPDRVPRTMLPGGRGPRRVAPVRGAGRFTVPPNPSPDRGIGSPMVKWTGDARRYRIVIRSECGGLPAGLVDKVRCGRATAGVL